MDMPIKRMNHKELTTAHDWVNKHFTFIDNHKNYSYSDILVFAEKVLKYEGLDGVLIDPYNALHIDMSAHRGISTHEYHYEAVRVPDLQRQESGCHVGECSRLHRGATTQGR